jgi:glycosyltransferase involved in cell wall biosynthesis
LAEECGLKVPSVSVIICGHDQAEFIPATIRSVASQRFKNFQCVVVDDASSDGTAERVVECLADMGDDRFRAVLRSQNGGQMAAMLTGLDHVDDPFVAFLDGDDLYHPAFLEFHMQAHMSAAGAAALSSSDLFIIDDQAMILAGGFPPFHTTDPRTADLDLYDIATASVNGSELTFVPAGPAGWIWSATSGMVFRRSVLDLARPADPSAIRICADSYWAPFAHIVGGSLRIEKPLGMYRLHGGNHWANGHFLGGLLELGAVHKDLRESIQISLAAQLCAVAEQVAEYDLQDQVARSVIAMLGPGRSMLLCGRNSQAYEVLWEHLPKTPQSNATSGVEPPDTSQ